MDMEMCKLCFTMTASQQPVANSPFSQEFHKFKFIGLEIGYGMPETICGQCLIQLNQLGSFLKVCKDSFHIYKQLKLKQKKSLEKKIKQEPIDYKTEDVNIDLTNESENLSETVLSTEPMEFEPKSENQTDYSYCHTDGVDLEEVTKQGTCQTCNEDVITLFDHYNESRKCNPKFSKCPFCDAYFRNTHKLLLHQTSHHPDEASMTDKICDICSKSFNCQDSLSQHLQEHENNNQYACEQSDMETIEDESGIKNSPSQSVAKKDNIFFSISNQYEITYKKFMKWRKTRNMNSYSENVLMAFCEEMARTQSMRAASSQFWQLRSTLFERHNVDLTKYLRVRGFLKRHPWDSTALEPNILTPEQIQVFLKEASDRKYLLIKVVVAFVISGGCRKEELWKLTVDDLEELNSAVRVRISLKGTRVRTFIITGELFNIYKKYANCRPPNLPHNRFFVNYQHGQLPVGMKTFNKMARNIAIYLGLPKPKAYAII